MHNPKAKVSRPYQGDAFYHNLLQLSQYNKMLPKTNYPKSNFVDIFSARFNLGKHLRFAVFLEIGLDLGVVMAVHSDNK